MQKIISAQLKYYYKNKVTILKQRKLYRQKNKLHIKLYNTDYNKKHLKYKQVHAREYYYLHREQYIKYSKEYRKNNRKKISLYGKKYRVKNIKQRRKYEAKIRENIQHRLARNLRERLRQALKNNRKSKTTVGLLGCSTKFLKRYLEKQFTSGMSWDNYGKWHIDHIRPCYSFDLSESKEQKKCFHYSNLRPLWAEDNLRRNKKVRS